MHPEVFPIAAKKAKELVFRFVFVESIIVGKLIAGLSKKL
jgi:hypothetical protein